MEGLLGNTYVFVGARISRGWVRAPPELPRFIHCLYAFIASSQLLYMTLALETSFGFSPTVDGVPKKLNERSSEGKLELDTRRFSINVISKVCIFFSICSMTECIKVVRLYGQIKLSLVSINFSVKISKCYCNSAMKCH